MIIPFDAEFQGLSGGIDRFAIFVIVFE